MEPPHSKRSAWSRKEWYEGISKQARWVSWLNAVHGPRTLRQRLGLSESQMARVLSLFTPLGHQYTRQSIAHWERIERGVRQPQRYAMTDNPRCAYDQLVYCLVEATQRRPWRVRAKLGARRWRFELESDCVQCGRPFIVQHGRARRCRRCLSRGA